jgi:hypothetical protein
MPKNQESKPPSEGTQKNIDKINIEESEPGESWPLVVAAKDVGKIILGYSKKTAANDRWRKRGPPYYMIGGTPYYLVSELIEYFTKNRVETFND